MIHKYEFYKLILIFLLALPSCVWSVVSTPLFKFLLLCIFFNRTFVLLNPVNTNSLLQIREVLVRILQTATSWVNLQSTQNICCWANNCSRNFCWSWSQNLAKITRNIEELTNGNISVLNWKYTLNKYWWTSKIKFLLIT